MFTQFIVSLLANSPVVFWVILSVLSLIILEAAYLILIRSSKKRFNQNWSDYVFTNKLLAFLITIGSIVALYVIGVIIEVIVLSWMIILMLIGVVAILSMFIYINVLIARQHAKKESEEEFKERTNYRFDVGEVVVVRDDLKVGDRYGAWKFTDSNSKFSGDIVTIEKYYDDRTIKLEESNINNWTEEMFETLEDKEERDKKESSIINSFLEGTRVKQKTRTKFKVGDLITGLKGNPGEYEKLTDRSICRVLEIDEEGDMKVLLLGHKDAEEFEEYMGNIYEAPAENFVSLKIATAKRVSKEEKPQKEVKKEKPQEVKKEKPQKVVKKSKPKKKAKKK